MEGEAVSYYTYGNGRRGIRQDHRAARDELSNLVYKPMLAEPRSWLKEFGAITGVVAAGITILYIVSYFVGKSKGWW